MDRGHFVVPSSSLPEAITISGNECIPTTEYGVHLDKLVRAHDTHPGVRPKKTAVLIPAAVNARQMQTYCTMFGSLIWAFDHWPGDRPFRGSALPLPCSAPVYKTLLAPLRCNKHTYLMAPLKYPRTGSRWSNDHFWSRPATMACIDTARAHSWRTQACLAETVQKGNPLSWGCHECLLAWILVLPR